MRRSGAPSQLRGNAAKKPRFMPPGPGRNKTQTSSPTKTKTTVPSLPPPTPALGNVLLNKVQRCLSSADAPAVSDAPVGSKALVRVLGAVPRGECKENSFRSSGPDFPEPEQLAEKDSCSSQPNTHASCTATACYYSVMWCKASSRKHKRWEGDAVLVAKGRTVVLKDMEGRDIGRGSGYKASELESLCEGQTLMVGGKQIEVMGVISKEDYAKGRCFQDAAVETPAETVLKAPVYRLVSKSFTRPALKGGALRDSEPDKPICKPRHDPNAPGALVMPRPTTDHQWLNNKSGSPLVDVVIDPHLTNHLRPHQREGVVFLYECLMGMRLPGRCGAILADEMGLGKTLQCVCVLWTLLRQGPYGGRPVLKRALVVCPGSLVKNWAAEFNKWLGRERISVYTVDQDHRVEDFVSSPLCSVMVISYEMLLRSVDQLKELDFGVLICDEGHRLKNSNIKTSSAVTALSCERRLILTGTPVQNDLQEFYSIVEFVNPGILGTSSAYRKIYEEPILRSRQPTCTEEERCIGEERAAELFRLTGVFTLRRTQEIINQYLSERIEWTVFCKPTELQLRLYGVLLATRPIRACLSSASTNTYTHSPHLACINALKKLCNHPALLYKTLQEKSDELYEDGIMELFPEGYSTGAFSTADSGKLLVLTDLLSAIQNVNRTDRVVLVSNYTQTLDLLQEVCDHIGYKWCRLDGQTPVAQRQRIVDSFNSPHSSNFLLLLSSKAGGVGLNLIGASHLVLYDIDWNPANDIQAMARVWRDGQKKTVHTYRFLTTGSIEEKIYQRQVSKQGLSGTVVDLSKKAEHISFSAEELRDLFSFDPNTTCLTHNLLDCQCTGDGNTPGFVKEIKEETGRACQLGRHADSTASFPQRVSMSELMHWRHFSGDVESYDDIYLNHARNHITYAFQSTTSKSQTTV
ncbi:LOW QUALITY PROTEIN: DNA repair and recombination protein RAD54B-like [Cyprinus carpio]|uniref:LOW QUALITY PROTEIN: DNA repair and recombination protein RAD54B-like n=1 Tax=Cyprinus carpio TaxID=7962 RepID=A0A9Q9YY26_CYPCA|nr:LOW QUALITY PROTEIN: DNA repair and recombination protein RAD54B-like [Cyprinus carpio]